MSKISELSDGGVIQGGDTLIAVRSGGNVKVTYGGTTTANIDGGTIDNTVIGGTTPAAGNFTTGSFTGDVSFGDNDALRFGSATNGDLVIKHDGINSSIVDRGDGDLIIQGSTNVKLQNFTGSKDYFVGSNGGASTVYYDGSAKLATTSTGIDVTGTVTADDSITLAATPTSLDENRLIFNETPAAGSLGSRILWRNPSTGYDYASVGFTNEAGSSGGLRFKTASSVFSDSDALRMKIADNGDVSLFEDTGTTAKFFWDASTERLGLNTTTPEAGIQVAVGSSTIPSAGSSGSSAVFGNATSGSAYGLALGANSSGVGYISAQRTDGAATTYNLAIQPNGGNVGIGTDSPQATIQTKNTSNSATLASVSNSFSLSHQSGSYTEGHYYSVLGFAKANSNGATIGAAIAPVMTGGGDTRGLAFGIASGGGSVTEKFRLDDSGNLLVGTTDLTPGNGNTDTGHLLKNDGRLFVSSASNSQFNRNSDGDIVTFRQSGNLVGSIGTNGGDLFVGTGNTKLRFDDASDAIHAGGGDGSGTNAGTDLGTGTYKFGDLYLSGGAYLGGTGSANHLDDYEEGTFTPTLYRDSTEVTATYTNRTGRYIKIGSLVHVYCDIVTSAITSQSSGYNYVGGLPFNYNGQPYATIGVVASNMFSGTAISKVFAGQNQNTVLFGSDESSSFPPKQLAWSSGALRFSFSYYTAS